MVLAGFALQPDDEFLARTTRAVRAADYLEIAPETTWREREDGVLEPNGFQSRFAAAAAGRPLVAHGVGLSMASDDPEDAARTERWLARMRADQERLRYAWWTDHLGATTLAGEALTHPMPVMMDAATARVIAAKLERMASVVPDVGVENTVVHFVLGDPLDEPAFLGRVLAAERRWLLLDLHNVVTMAENLDFDPRAFIARCDLSRVLEIHVSGGSESDPRWLPSGRVLRLDGHDGPVPELVWTLLDEVLPRCPHLRGVTLERMEGTVRSDAAAREVVAEMTRLRTALERHT